ncbi:MAG TPA: hypothetical protein VG165_12985 [Solirubrobacteraceae bacterium]|nr:hypothetical protein [Solirubrobacteraceae bacterium]
MDDHGPAVSYLTLRRGTRVLARDGTVVGRVRRVLAAQRQDVFHGLLVDTAAGDRVVVADQIASMHERAVVLRIGAADARLLPGPASDPAARPSTPLQALDDLAGKLWRRLSTFK